MTIWPEFKDWRWYACLVVGIVLLKAHPITAGFVAGAGATSFYLLFFRRPK